MSTNNVPLTLELVLGWAHAGHQWKNVQRFLFFHPEDLFVIPYGRAWPLAHQIVYHGNIDLIKQILPLYSDDLINIRTLSKDRKSLLDVAREQQKIYPAMYTFMERLFLQDDLIKAAKYHNWDLVNRILEQDRSLVNEKPPYATNFLLHYLIEYGDKKVLEDFMKRFEFQTNVLSADNETPLDLAKRLERKELLDVFEPKQQEQLQPSSTASLTNSSFGNRSFSLPTNSVYPSSLPSAFTSYSCPYPTTDPFPCPSFDSFKVSLNNNGNFVLSPQNPFSSIHIELTSPDQQTTQMPVIDTSTNPDTQNINTTATDQLDAHAESAPETPVTPATKTQLIKSLTCPLTRQIFVDPVIADDGQTYERNAITNWLKSNQTSPTTGTLMTTSFIENGCIKQIIQSLKKLKN
ncbi:unnamed protein product [Adineta ricciae]|uniref:U-box domain-containing protein n=1 Tax=Adineta ricciae TaxID=249248 RepID=A0A814WYI0_ADIRI|nr:unnamed protein product [Adineta ricciae]CAF1387373.1 unnamed protein product [Adineta ricciae]